MKDLLNLIHKTNWREKAKIEVFTAVKYLSGFLFLFCRCKMHFSTQTKKFETDELVVFWFHLIFILAIAQKKHLVDLKVFDLVQKRLFFLMIDFHEKRSKKELKVWTFVEEFKILVYKTENYQYQFLATKSERKYSKTYCSEVLPA